MRSNSLNNLKKETKNHIEREKLLDLLIENPDLINDWPIDRLEKLEKICDRKIAEYK